MTQQTFSGAVWSSISDFNLLWNIYRLSKSSPETNHADKKSALAL